MLGSIIGSVIGAGASFLGASRNEKMQKNFAKKGIQWKVKDSLKAGIHPLYGLGANTMSFSPSNVGGEVSQIASNLGADIDRSRMASSDKVSRGVIGKLALERAGLENDLLRAQIASTNARLGPSQMGPAMPAIAGMIPERIVTPQRTTGVNVGFPIRSAPRFSDAQAYEDRYGELGGSAIGLGNIPADLFYNWYKGFGPSVKAYPKYKQVYRSRYK